MPGLVMLGAARIDHAPHRADIARLELGDARAGTRDTADDFMVRNTGKSGVVPFIPGLAQVRWQTPQ